MLVVAAVFLTGCSTLQDWWGDVQPILSNNVDQIIHIGTNALEQLRDETNVVRRAVVVSLTEVDPDAYGGWDGACPGTDVDGDVFALLCHEAGIPVIRLANDQATKADILSACVSVCAGMQPGDLFVLFYSGHGGQVPDTNGDEEDGADETLCLWDGQLVDDRMGELWQQIPPGVRVFFVTDSCNAGSSFRAAPISARAFLPRDYTGALVHFGGCADGQSSFGSASGGVWTTALIDAWQPGGTYREWFRRAAAKMPLDQLPAYAEYGHVADSFRNAPALK
jgi:hypothetical protein